MSPLDDFGGWVDVPPAKFTDSEISRRGEVRWHAERAPARSHMTTSSVRIFSAQEMKTTASFISIPYNCLDTASAPRLPHTAVVST